MPTALVADEALALQRLFHWEKTAPEKVVFTQPMGDGRVVTATWRQAIDQARRMAAHLQSVGVGRGDRVAILSKNTAHWLMSDWAIWLAGAVSVPLYPTLAAGTIRQILGHSGSKLLFVGKLDGWESMKPGVPPGMPCIAHPLAPDDAKKSYPGWDEIVAHTAPLAGHPVRPADELATIMYTSGTTGMPKGVMHSFGTFAWGTRSGLERVPQIDENARMLSYLPLSHVAERTLVEHGQLAKGMHVYFAESLETFTADLQRARPTVFFSVPRLWVKFQQGVSAKMPPEKLERLLKIPILRGIVKKKILAALGLQECRFAAGGAAPMPPEMLRWCARLGLDLVKVYGMTENCGISHATLPGKQRPGTVGLLMLNPEAARRAADPAGRAELEASLGAHLQRINAALDPHEQIECVVVTRESWSVDNDLVTPTFKVKRNRIEERFAPHYESWVAARRKVIWHDA